MSDLTEVEIYDVIRSNLRDGASNCDLLVKLPAKGPTYRKLRENLQLIEGGCRQMGGFRYDMRYHLLGLKAAECHKRAGDWLRSHAASTLFFKLAEALRKILYDMEKLHAAKTGTTRPILPPVAPGPHRDTRPVYVKRPSGLLLPAA